MQKKIINLTVGPIATNCWIYPLSEKDEANIAAVIDPGDEAGVIISALQKLDLFPKYILLTHGHFDHIGAVRELSDFFSKEEGKAPVIAIHSGDAEYLGAEAYSAHSKSIKAAMGAFSADDSSLIDDFGKGLPPASRLLKEGDEIGTFTVLHLPGHTRGSIAFWDKEEGVIFTGDTLFLQSYGRTDLPGGDEEEIFKSLHRLFSMDAKIKVFPGHGPATTIGHEAEWGIV